MGTLTYTIEIKKCACGKHYLPKIKVQTTFEADGEANAELPEFAPLGAAMLNDCLPKAIALFALFGISPGGQARAHTEDELPDWPTTL